MLKYIFSAERKAANTIGEIIVCIFGTVLVPFHRMKTSFALLALLFTFTTYGQSNSAKKTTITKDDSLKMTIRGLVKDTMVIQEAPFVSIHDFKGKEGAFVLDVERESRKVMVFILVENLKDYKEVYVQRSDETMIGTGNCKYFTPKDFKLKKYTEVIFEDKYPLPAQRNSYYRIKCEDLHGVVRTYPWILLPSIK